MTWTRLSDDFTERPDIAGLSDSAWRAHVEAIVWCNKQLTDGRIPADPKALARVLPGAPTELDELVRAGLWRQLPDGDYQIDWSDQEPAERVKRGRAVTAERQRKFRDRKSRHDAGDHSECDARYCRARAEQDGRDASRNALRNGVTNGVRNAVSNRPRPVPSRPKDRDREQRTGSAAKSASPPPPAGSRHAAPPEDLPTRADWKRKSSAS